MAYDPDARDLATTAKLDARQSRDAPGSIIAALQSDRSVPMLLQGDSTGDGTDRWFYGLGQRIGQAFPSARVEYRAWDNGSSEYLGETVIQVGSAGRRCLTPATGGGVIPASEIGDWSTDIDLRIFCKPTTWIPGSNKALVARYGTAGNKAFEFYHTTSGGQTFLRFEWSADGTASNTINASTFVVADGTPLWVRLTLDVDNGASGYDYHFYSSTDGVTWTDRGSGTGVGVTSIYKPASQQYAIGEILTGSHVFSGDIYAVQIRDGINGPIMNPQPIETWRQYGGTSSIGGSPTLYMWNGSMTGQGISYLSDATRLPKMVPPLWTGIVYLSTGHNENQTFTQAQLDTWLTRLRARVRAPVSVMIQNPRVSPAIQRDFHAQFVREFGTWARRNGLEFDDIFRAFYSSGQLSALMNADGIHPSTGAGVNYWMQTVFNRYQRWL